MLMRLRMCANHARRVRAERTLVFQSGVNVIVGPNGSGKSTILNAIRLCEDCEKETEGDTFFHYFNTETMNPRTMDGPVGNMTNMILRVRSIFSSHGQIMKTALTSLPIRKGDCLLVDEPESGQDLEGILLIKEGFKAICEEGGQVVIASHHPAFWKDAHVIELGKGYTEAVRQQCRDIVSDTTEDS